METTGWKFAGTIVPESVTVDDLNKMKTADDIFAVCSTIYDAKLDYHFLYFTNFGFSVADIPVGATILGIEVAVNRYTGTSGVSNAYRMRPSDGGSYFKDGGSWPMSAGVQNMGSSSDLWERSWVRDNILSSDFGVVLTIETSTDSTFYIDYVKIRVTYSGGETVPAGSKAFLHYYKNLMAGGVGRQC